MPLHVLEDFLDGQRLAADELLEVIGVGRHLVEADGAAEDDHAVGAEWEVGRELSREKIPVDGPVLKDFIPYPAAGRRGRATGTRQNGNPRTRL